MGRHVAVRTASIGSFIGIPQRAEGLPEPRGRLFGRRAVLPPEPQPLAVESMITITQTMAILERIAERRAQYVGVSLGLVDRIQTLP